METNDLHAYCTSYKCTNETKTTRGVIKLVPKYKSNCPDCGSILVWRKLRGALHVADNSAHKRKTNTGLDLFPV